MDKKDPAQSHQILQPPSPLPAWSSCFCSTNHHQTPCPHEEIQHLCQVAERKHKPTVLEFMEPLIDQTTPGTVEEEYMVSIYSTCLDALGTRCSMQASRQFSKAEVGKSCIYHLECLRQCGCQRRSNEIRCTDGSACVLSRGSTCRCAVPSAPG